MRLPCRAAAASLALALLAVACGEPPNKELHQAQGAIEAARAAGAERYATEEFTAAVEALRRADEAVRQRDYRLALNHALDSRERAQNAAREAADAKAAARGRAERMLAEVTTALAAAGSRMSAAEAARVTQKALAEPTAAIAAAQQAVQEAGSALGREDYLAAQQALEGRAAAIQQATRQIDQAIAASPPPRPGRRRR
jgi:Domain of unknown function (DUF4398)